MEQEKQDRTKIETLKKEIDKSIKREMSTGKSHCVAEALAYIEARKVAVKTLGYVPEGFWVGKG